MRVIESLIWLSHAKARREADAQKRAQAAARAAEEVRRGAEEVRRGAEASARGAADAVARAARAERLQGALLGERNAALDEARFKLLLLLYCCLHFFPFFLSSWSVRACSA
jgi:hypothetical protein